MKTVWVLIYCDGCGETNSIELCITNNGYIKGRIPRAWANDRESNMLLCKDCVSRENSSGKILQ